LKGRENKFVEYDKKTMNVLDFDAITTMTMGDDEGAKKQRTCKQSYIGVRYER
jgi:hypothetical protein